jgi:DNA repair exonuclease SbcCD nuclease subunit
MKIALASDIHLEFGDITLTNDENADVLVLAGDICVVRDLIRKSDTMVRDFFVNCCAQFPTVIYIMGNHEHYHGDFAKSHGLAQAVFDELGLANLHLLEKSTVTINDITFIGGTLWTDCNRGDAMTVWHAGRGMSDYRTVTNTRSGKSGGSWRLLPEHTMEDHLRMKDYISIVVQGKPDQRFVVVGHHAPSFKSVDDIYKHDTVMNGNFFSDLEQFILDRPQIELWIHGHMHNRSDYYIGKTRVVDNPRGYIGHEDQAVEFKLLYIDL